MQNQYRVSGFSFLPPVVKNLLIINGLMFLATLGFQQMWHIDLKDTLGLFYYKSEHFRVYQIITHMFMHANFTHILFNMFALWMFGYAIENRWGGKRFLNYYLITGLGAAFLHMLVLHFRAEQILGGMDINQFQEYLSQGKELLNSGRNYKGQIGDLNLIYHTSTVGASGAVYGILLAFGMLFPNVLIYIYFLFPIKAKWFVVIFGVLELVMGVSNQPGDNVAHFAHLGGMIFGYILIKFFYKR